MKIPEKFADLVRKGQNRLLVEKQRQTQEQLAKNKQNTQRERKKLWGFLCTEAKIDLGPDVSEYVKWTEPETWNQKCHCFYINIPGFSTIVAEYKLHNEYDWCINRIGFCSYEKTKNSLVKVWNSYETKPIDQILAMAYQEQIKKEQFVNLEKIIKVHIEEIEAA
jgi:hypothetical protein